MRFLLVTGLSGAGKTAALRYLEDMGAFCVDNLPPAMLVRLMTESAAMVSSTAGIIAFSVDVRSGAFFDATAVTRLILETQQLGFRIETLFLEASEETLVERYKETRREHPLAGDHVTLTQAITLEREMLQPLRETADLLIDTTDMKPRALQRTIRSIVSRDDGNTIEMPMHIEVISFGFKRGLPKQADLVLDVRFLPNPFYIPELCRHSGLDEDVRAFVMNHPVTMEFMKRETELLGFLLPHYQEEGKRRLMLAVGCTGGAHRSVAIAEAIGQWLCALGYRVDLIHRDVDVEQAHWQSGSEEV